MYSFVHSVMYGGALIALLQSQLVGLHMQMCIILDTPQHQTEQAAYRLMHMNEYS